MHVTSHCNTHVHSYNYIRETFSSFRHYLMNNCSKEFLSCIFCVNCQEQYSWTGNWPQARTHFCEFSFFLRLYPKLLFSPTLPCFPSQWPTRESKEVNMETEQRESFVTFTRPSTRSRSWTAWANVSWRKLQKMLRKRRWVTAASRCAAVTTSPAPSPPAPASTGDRGKKPYTAGVQLANWWRHESRFWYKRFFVNRAWACAHTTGWPGYRLVNCNYISIN